MSKASGKPQSNSSKVEDSFTAPAYVEPTYTSAPAAVAPTTESFARPEKLKQMAAEPRDMSAVVSGLLATVGVPTRVNKTAFDGKMARIFNLVDAKSEEQKEAVRNTLTYIAIVYGSGPNVKWADVPFQVVGCRTTTVGSGPDGAALTRDVNMADVVDGIITRAYHRRFMANFSQRAVQMHNSSEALQMELKPRATRAGLPITDTLAVIDFLTSDDMDARSLANRTMAKYSNIARNNKQGLTSMDRAARAATNAVHDYNDEFGNGGTNGAYEEM